MRIADVHQSPILAIMRASVRGYLKERVLLVVLIFAFILMISSYVLAPLAVGAQQKIIVDIGLASISFFGVMLVILLGASSYSREKDGGILAAILSKPVRRSDFVLGKYFGTTITVSLVMVVMALVYLAVMFLSDARPNGVTFIAMYLSIIEVALVTAVMSFFSTFTSPLLSSFFTFCVFVAGHLSKDLLAFAEQFGGNGFQSIAKAGYYTLPNLSLFNLRMEAVHGLPLMDGYGTTVTAYAALYVAVLLFASAAILGRKDVI